jgi:hypothetical protein
MGWSNFLYPCYLEGCWKHVLLLYILLLFIFIFNNYFIYLFWWEYMSGVFLVSKHFLYHIMSWFELGQWDPKKSIESEWLIAHMLNLGYNEENEFKSSIQYLSSSRVQYMCFKKWGLSLQKETRVEFRQIIRKAQ